MPVRGCAGCGPGSGGVCAVFVFLFICFPAGAHRTIHHIQVPDEDSPTQAPELIQAEAAIEKQNYAAAEGLLHKLVERDATSYVGWFDLGFVENALGNVDGSIAAYRKSVAAKPDVFESNLKSGIAIGQDFAARRGGFFAGCDATETDESCGGRAIPGVARSRPSDATIEARRGSGRLSAGGGAPGERD